MNKKIVSVQDISCFGQCSLTVALPIISALGIETAVIPTTVLSTHTGKFKNYTFCDLTSEIPKIQKHWNEYNIKFDALYSGYLGSPKQIDYVLDLYNSIKLPDSKLYIDPVMGDNGKFYSGFTKEFAKLMKKYCSYAAVITPNITEAHFLMESGELKGSYTEKEMIDTAKNICCHDDQKVIITGIPVCDNKMAVASYDSKSSICDIYYQPRITGNFHGTGDIFASMCFALLLKNYTLSDAVRLTSDFVVSCIRNTPDTSEHWYGVHFEECLKEIADL